MEVQYSIGIATKASSQLEIAFEITCTRQHWLLLAQTDVVKYMHKQSILQELILTLIKAQGLKLVDVQEHALFVHALGTYV